MVSFVEGPCGCSGCAPEKVPAKKPAKVCPGILGRPCGSPEIGGFPYAHLCEACAEMLAS